MFERAGARLVPIPVDEQGARVDVVRQAMTTRPPALIYVHPTFHNPTGVLLAERRRQELIRIASEQAVPILENLVLSDVDLANKGTPLPMAANNGNLIISIGSLSTVFWSGLRIGWLRAPKRMLGRFKDLKANVDLGTGLIDQFIAARLLGSASEARAHQSRQLRANYLHLTSRLNE